MLILSVAREYYSTNSRCAAIMARHCVNPTPVGASMNIQRKKEDFLFDNRISLEQWDATDLTWDELLAIGEAYEKQIPHLEAAAALLANTIQRFDAVHSVRWRVKDSEHLIAKIIRKRAAGNTKYADISVLNYSEVITDLIGIRALHLFKADFEKINKSIVDSFVLRDKTVVYVREGDDPKFSQQCIDSGFAVELHPQGYRSIHYIVTTQPLKYPIHVEVQVRTIFEEGWSEIDHIIRYPNYSDDVQLAYLLTIFNRMAGSADEMGGFVRILAGVLKDAKSQLADALREKDESLAKVESAIEQLAAKKTDLADDDQIKAAKQELNKLKAGPTQIKHSSFDLLQYIAEHGVTGVREDSLKSYFKFSEDPGGVKAFIKSIEDPSDVKAILKNIEDPGGVKAFVKSIEDPGGVKAILKDIEDPGGIKSAMRGLGLDGDIKPD